MVSLHAKATVCPKLEPHPHLSSGIGQSKTNKAAPATWLCKSALASLEPCAVSFVVTFCLKTMAPLPAQAADWVHCLIQYSQLEKKSHGLDMHIVKRYKESFEGKGNVKAYEK